VDVNGTRFHLILGEEEWLPVSESAEEPSTRGVEWSAGAVRLRKLLPVFPSHRSDVPPGIDARRGAARDRHGHWYWISDDGHEIRVARLGLRPSTLFWSAQAAARGCAESPENGVFSPVLPPVLEPLRLSGLAVTTEHYLVAGRSQPDGLLIFDLRGGGGPLMLDWPATEPLATFDISATADGGFWVLDRSARRLWRLDRFFRIVGAGAPAPASSPAAPFTPLVQGEAPVCPPPSPIAAELALPLTAVDSPDAVEALPDGSVLVLDNPAGVAHSILHRYRLDGTHFAVALDASLNPPANGGSAGGAEPMPLRGHDIAFVAPEPPPRPLTGVLYVAGAAGNQSFAFDFTSAEDAFALALRREYFPMRRFSGKALVSAFGRVYYDFGERWVSLVEHPNPRFVASGTIVLPGGAADAAFDGKEVRCVWHRLLIDACIPYESNVTVETRSGDRANLLDELPWQTQPDLYRRGDGSELPYHRPAIGGDDRHAGTWELLLQNVVGRYLQVRLRIQGTGRTTPRLHALRAHYPRFSYLHRYLPAVYRDDAVSAFFLDRYLANVEGIYTTIEGKIERVETLFDTRTAPAEYLDWLAGWLGTSLDFSWSERTRRLFLAHAPQMFEERATCAGLVRAIRLALDPCPTDDLFVDSPCAGRSAAGFGVRVVEKFRARSAAGVVFGDPTDLLGPGSTTNVSDWTPARGALPLHQQYRAFLRQRYSDRIEDLNAAWQESFSSFDDPALQLQAIRPSGREGADWQRFVESEIGFTYAVARDEDESLYREFLARRYGQPSAVNQAYSLGAAAALRTWADVRDRLWDGRLRVALPDDNVWLRDWIEFVSSVLPTERAAHRFTVLVPVGLDDGPEQQLARRRLAERITEIEKPAHAAFDVKLYWGLFRVGEARLGLDTLIGTGSRSVALVLDRELLGGAHLGFLEPWNARDRLVVGREGDLSPGGTGNAVCCCRPSAAPIGRGCGCERG
jgi:phage tail-like protein